MPDPKPNNHVTLTDGAWGTQFDAMGCPPGFCRERWNTEEPDKVLQVARAYIDAGSEAILTNTFTGNRVILDRHGLADRAFELNRAGAAISRRAAGDAVKVFGSIGPSGKLVMMEEIDPAELADAFAEQASALVEGGVDAIVCESMTELAEALIAVRAVRKTTSGPIVASLVFDSGPERCHTQMGDPIERSAAELADAGANVLGINCGVGIAEVVQPAAKLREATDLPIWIKPNAGLPQLVDGLVVYKETPQEFADNVAELLEIGIDFIGGCCGTTPEHIAAVARILGKQ